MKEGDHGNASWGINLCRQVTEVSFLQAINNDRFHYRNISCLTCYRLFPFSLFFFSVALSEVQDLKTGAECPHTQDAGKVKKVVGSR